MNTESKPCPFCPVNPKHILLEHPLALVKRDPHPLTQGHALVIPRRHVALFFDCTRDEQHAMLALLDEARALLDKAHAPDGYNIGINNGAAAGQTVMHVHMHLIPRYAGDTSDPRGGVRWIFPEKAVYWANERKAEQKP
jgi:diadenosine tetraphosphate (Ap4A) HIT family hydrolase